MPDTLLDGVVKLEEKKDTTGGEPKPEYTDEQLEKMAKDSGDTVEHMREMLNLGTKKDTGNAGDTNDNKLLAGKYKTEEELSKGIQSLIDKYVKEEAYKLLEAAAGKKASDDNTDKGENVDDKKDALTDNKAAAGEDGNTDDQKIDMNKYFDEYAEGKGLSIESYKELADAGFDKDLVDGYIEGQNARVELFTNQVHNLAGGEDQFNAMVEWGTTNLSDAQKETFNTAVNSGNLETARGVVEALQSRYEKTEGSFKRGGIKPNDSINAGPGAEGYASTAEMQVAMRDPRYKTDAAYVAQVQARVKASKF